MKKIPIWASIIVLVLLSALPGLGYYLNFKNKQAKIVSSGGLPVIDSLRLLSDGDLKRINDDGLKVIYKKGVISENGLDKIAKVYEFKVVKETKKGTIFFVFDNFDYKNKSSKPNVDIKSIYRDRAVKEELDSLFCFYNDGVYYELTKGDSKNNRGHFLKYSEFTGFDFKDPVAGTRQKRFLDAFYTLFTKTVMQEISVHALIACCFIPLVLIFAVYFLSKTFERTYALWLLLAIGAFVQVIAILVSTIVIIKKPTISVYLLYVPLYGGLYMLITLGMMLTRYVKDRKKENEASIY